LLAQMQAQTNSAVLLISHDLRNVIKRADTIAVMRHGQLLEHNRTDDIGREASHPYTRMLLEAKPDLMDIERIHQKMAVAELSLPYPLSGLA
jgi:peptide/nickel transport system ATP-binding protein